MPNDMKYVSYGELSNADSTTMQYKLKMDSSGIGSAIDGSLNTPKYTLVKTTTTTEGGVTKTVNKPTAVLKNTLNKYVFFVNGVVGAKNSKYDIRVTMDASGHTDYNDQEMASIASMNGTYDCVWTDTASDRSNAIEELYSHRPADKLTASKSDINNYYQRELVIDIADVNAVPTGSPNYAVTFTNKYTAKNGSTVYAADYTAPAVTKFYSDVTGQPPRNIYVFLWPNYTTDAAHYDTVTVNDTAGLAVRVYLIRMKVDATEYSKATSDGSNEADYKMNLNLNGTFSGLKFVDYNDDNKIALLKDNMLSVCTNMRENINYSHAENENNPAGYYKEERMKVTSNIMDSEGKKLTENVTTQHVSGTAFTALSTSQLSNIIFDLASSATKDKLYDLTVEVFDANSGDSNYAADKLLTSFTGGASE